MKNYKAVIFDLDGVICSTDQYHYRAWKRLADHYGIPFDETVNNRLRGVSRAQSLEIILEKNPGRPFTDAEKKQMLEEKNSTYRSLLSNMTPADLSDEVKNTLDALRKRGKLLAIGSSSRNTKYILKRLGLGSYFDAVSDGTNITKSKPDPEVFLDASEMLHQSPKDCIVIEDAAAGIEAACRGEFDSCGISDASHCSKTTYPIRRFSDLLDIIR